MNTAELSLLTPSVPSLPLNDPMQYPLADGN